MKIFANIIDVKKIEFEIDKNNKISFVMKEIEKKIGFSSGEQKLVFKGRILDENMTFYQCRIVENSVINVIVILKKLKIIVKTIEEKIFKLEVIKSDTVLDIKKMVQENMDLAVKKQILSHNGIVLEDDNKTVEDYNIVENSVINVITRFRNGFLIFAKTVDGIKISLEVTKGDTILNIKKKIHQKMKLSANEPLLVFKGRMLEDNKTVDQYRIFEKSVINVIVVLKQMEIYCQTVDRKTDIIKVVESDTVLDLKKMIQDKMKISVEEQILVYNETMLEDNNKMVEEYSIVEKDVIHIVCRQLKVMTIFIKTMDQGTISLRLGTCDSVLYLKKKIEETTGRKVNQQELVYQGETLKDSKTLEDYEIEENCTILILHIMRD